MTQEHFEHNSEQRDDIEETSPPTQKANSATTDVVQLEILKLLKEMRENNKKLNTNKNNSNTQGNNNNNRNNQNNNNNSNQSNNDGVTQRKRRRRDTSKYCSSCGAGNHIGKDCFKKGANHKDKATFQHMMGGCTDFCQVVNE